MQQKFKRQRTRFDRFRRVRLPRRLRKLKKMSRHPHAVPFLTIGALLLVTGGGFLTAAIIKNHRPASVNLDTRIVIISHDDQQQIVPSREATVGVLLQKLHLNLNQGDVVEPAANTVIDQDEFRINIYRAVPVEVVDGANRTFTFSAATTPRSIAKQAGVTTFPEDAISTDPAEDFIRTGSIGKQVVIERSLPINLNLYGTAVATRTHASTVGELIKQKGITLAKDDQLMPVADTPLTANAQVFVVRNGVKIESVTQTIPMPVQTISDPSLAYGTNAVRQQGSPGEQVITYQDTLRNGQVVGRTAIQTVVNRQPVTQIVVIGSSLSGIKGDMALAGIAATDYTYVDYIVSHESGWCPTKAQGQYGGCPPYSGSVPSGGGYGLCQSTPGSKMASAGADWATNPVTQLKWCSGYAHSRYGSWAAAYNHWVASRNW